MRDRTLVLNVLRGLNDRFSHLADLIQRQRPFPSYVDVLNDLKLTEMTMKTKPSAPPHALTTTALRPNASAPPPKAPSPRPSGGRNTRHGGRGGLGGSSGGWGSSQGDAPWSGPASRPFGAPSWPTSYNPFTGTFQMWAGLDPR